MSRKKAFIVRDEIAGFDNVIFHHHQVAARRIGAEALGVEFSDVSIRRCETLDQYSPGPVPKQALVDHGLIVPMCSRTSVHDNLRKELGIDV